MPRVLVVGYANRDHLVQLDALPVLGETLLAKGVTSQPGGKGANQAVAAARLGADVTFIGGVGDDKDGADILQSLETEGVRTDEVQVLSEASTGLALVCVLGDGDNAIVVVPGANALLDASRVEATLRRAWEPGGVIVVQAEVPRAVVAATARTAEELGARLVLNLAPYVDVAPETLAVADPLVLNETEAAALSGELVTDPLTGAAVASRLTGVSRSVVVTLGGSGAVWAHRSDGATIPAPPVEQVVDTAGAGDAFVGALATRLAEGGDLASAVAHGVAAGSFSVTRPGAQSSYPRAHDLAPAPLT